MPGLAVAGSDFIYGDLSARCIRFSSYLINLSGLSIISMCIRFILLWSDYRTVTTVDSIIYFPSPAYLWTDCLSMGRKRELDAGEAGR